MVWSLRNQRLYWQQNYVGRKHPHIGALDMDKKLHLKFVQSTLAVHSKLNMCLEMFETMLKDRNYWFNMGHIFTKFGRFSVQGIDQKQISFSSNNCRKASINDYFNGL